MKTLTIIFSVLLAFNAQASNGSGGLGGFLNMDGLDRGGQELAWLNDQRLNGGIGINVEDNIGLVNDMLSQNLRELMRDDNSSPGTYGGTGEYTIREPLMGMVKETDTFTEDTKFINASVKNVVYLNEASPEEDIQALSEVKKVFLVGSSAVEIEPIQVFAAVSANDATVSYSAPERFLKATLPEVSDALETSVTQHAWVTLHE